MKIKKLGPNMTELEYADGARVLVSYETPVAAYTKALGFVKSDRFHSRTTSQHISQWLDGVQATPVKVEMLITLMEEK